MPSSVTRLDDLLLFEQLFKARGNNYFAQIANTIQANFENLSKSFIFTSKILLCQLLQTFGDFLLVTLMPSQQLFKVSIFTLGALVGLPTLMNLYPTHQNACFRHKVSRQVTVLHSPMTITICMDGFRQQILNYFVKSHLLFYQFVILLADRIFYKAWTISICSHSFLKRLQI